MARPLSLYERHTTSTLPPPDIRERSHVVVQNENLLSIANVEYALEEYAADLWRDCALANSIDNPFTFDTDLRGQLLRIPQKPLPDFA
jgi:nucleoid-associated protein YgaU